MESDQPPFPDMVRLNSSGPSAERYPDSLGFYKRLPDITYNDLPVYKHVAIERFMFCHGKHAKSWYVSQELSLSARMLEFESLNTKFEVIGSHRRFNSDRKPTLDSDILWRHNLTKESYPNCRTYR